MKKVGYLLILTFSLLLPFASFASEKCATVGYTVATVNGIFTNDKEARQNMQALEDKAGEFYKNQPIIYQYLLNPSHVAGLGDLLTAVVQKYFEEGTVTDYDLTEMIGSAGEKISTQKVLLVAHSQGNFYANSFYDSLNVPGGIPPESMGVYSVATPASRVAGLSSEAKALGDGWLTSDTDQVIASVVGSVPGRKIMNPNTHIDLGSGDDQLGHSFSDVYLKYKGAEIVAGIDRALDKLKNNSIQKEDKPCFLSSPKSFGHKTMGVALAVVDPIAEVTTGVAVGTAAGAYKVGAFAVNTIYAVEVAVVETTKKVATAVVNTAVSATAAVGSAVDDVLAVIRQLAGRNKSAVVEALPPPPTVDNIVNAGNAELNMPLDDLLLLNAKKKTTTAKLALKSEVRPPEIIPPVVLAVATPLVVIPPAPAPTVVVPPIAPEPASVWIPYTGPTIGSGSNPVITPVVVEDPTPPPIPPAPEPEPPAPAVTSEDPVAPDLTFSIPGCVSSDCVRDFDQGNLTLNWSSTATDLDFFLLNNSGNLTKFSSTTLSITISIPAGESRSFSLASYSVPGLNSATSTKSVSVSLPPPTPVGTPDLTFSIPECDKTLSSITCLLTSGSVTLNWSSTASDVDFYLLNNNGDVTKFSSTTLSAVINISSETPITLSIASYAVGSASANTTGQASSATSTKSVYVSASPVVINEVAWNGTNLHSEDEWMELYNRSPYSVDLSNFVLYSKADMSPYIRLSGTLSSGGYYLIERKNDGETDEGTQGSVKDITADLWTSFGFGLNNTGENLVLSTVGSSQVASTTLDEISFCTNWCGSNSSGSYERYNPDLPGTSSSNWGPNYALIMNGKNVSGASIIGTPKARNSLNYLVNKNSDIVTDLTLKKNNSPYVIDDRMIQIVQGSTLKIEPGVVIKFNKTGKIKSYGNVVANGTTDSPIVFTAFADDTYGGDTDGVASTPTKGTWFGVELYTSATASSFDYTIFRYGGNYGNGLYTKAMLYAETSPTISNSVFEYSKGYGVSLKGSSSVVSGNTFRFNTGTTFSYGLYSENGTGGSIKNNIFSDNASGLYVFGFNGDIKDNTFTNNTTQSCLLSGPIVGTVSGNSGSGNTNNTIDLQGGISSAGATTTLSVNTLPYFLSGPVSVPALSALVFEDGATLKANMSGSAGNLFVYGRLEANGPPAGETGSSSSGVTFTSTGATTTKGAWNGVNMYAGSASRLTGLNINGAKIGIKYTSSPINLDNVSFTNNTTAVQSITSTVQKTTNVTFTNNTTNMNPAGIWSYILI